MAALDKRIEESLLQDITANNREYRADSVGVDHMIQTQMEALAGARDISQRKNCCCIFSLQTGIMLIVIVDVIVLTLLCCMTGMAYQDVENTNWTPSVDSDGNVTPVVPQGSGAAFIVLTDGFVLTLFSIRTFLGLFYLYKTIWPPKMDYQYLQEYGRLKWHTKRVKWMRINFKNYTLAANISSFFILVQTVVLLLVTFF